MATDGPDPTPCNDLLYRTGVTIDVIGETGGSCRFERLIQAASRRADVPIDWHFCGGRAVVLAFAKDAEKAMMGMKAEVYPVLEGPHGTIKVWDEVEV